MKKQNLSSQILQRVSDQIQTLGQHIHIQQVQKLNESQYKLLYCPKQTKSVYIQKSYNIELVLPKTYPNDPPSIRFLDHIYHLNIGYNTGQVRMSVLQDDWSPFLTLTSLIQSLDKILQQPDEIYALDANLLKLYQTDHDQYMKNVIQHVSLGDVVLCESAQRRIVKDQLQIQMQNQQQFSSFSLGKKQKKDDSKKKKNGFQLVKDLRQSMYEDDQQQKIQLDSKQEQLQKKQFKIIRTSSKQQLGNDKKSKSPPQSNKNKQAIQIKLSENNNNKRLQQKAKSLESSHESSYNEMAMHKINSAIRLFIEELNELQSQIQITKNQGIKKLLTQKYNSQLEMLRELMETSEEAKRKMVHKLKQQAKRI